MIAIIALAAVAVLIAVSGVSAWGMVAGAARIERERRDA